MQDHVRQVQDDVAVRKFLSASRQKGMAGEAGETDETMQMSCTSP